MATVAAPARVTQSTISAYDRVFYSGMAIAMAITVFIGFAPTYYLRPFSTPPATISGAATLTPLTQLHGALFSLWVLLFVAQTTLVATRRTALHQRLGIAGAVLAAAMLVVGSLTAIRAAARGSGPPGIEALSFLAIPIFDMLLFAGFISAALWSRRQRETHKRLMLLAYISLMAAATARLPGMFVYGPFAFFGLAFVFLIAGVLYDFFSRGRIHTAYVWGGLALVASVPVRLVVSDTSAWRTFAEFLTR
jgi:hypothetical protein